MSLRGKQPKMTIKNSKIFIAIFSIFYFLLSIFYLVEAQSSPQFLITLQGQNYAPGWYQGKVLPINKTLIETVFELVDNGKLADISKTKVRWYVNDKLAKNENNGLGIKSLRIATPDYAGGELKIRIVIVDYRGSMLDKTIIIPVVGPEVVIDAPYADKKISAGHSIFQLSPFFFNLKSMNNLSVEWSANGEKSQGSFNNPWSLDLNIDSQTPSGFVINLQAAVKSVLDELEFATGNLQLQVK